MFSPATLSVLTAMTIALLGAYQETSAQNAGVQGQWTAPLQWDVIAIHAALLRTGTVLHYSYPAGTKGSRARLWDPETGLFTPISVPTNAFCSGLGMLPDGKVLIAGGNDSACENQGRRELREFDPLMTSFTPVGLMYDGRWYPTVLPLADGRSLIFSGRDSVCHTNLKMEVYTPGFGATVLKGADRAVALFPRLHLLTSGLVAHVGQEGQAFTFDPNAVIWQFIDNNGFGFRCEGNSVLLPGFNDRILTVGGNCPPTTSAEIIDFSEPVPEFRLTQPMTFPRGHADALILPDATVMVVGGGQDGFYGLPTNTPELFDPQTETWTLLAPHTHGRMYHATTVLLPDARVLVAGQDNGPGLLTGEIFSPPYLFRGARPAIQQVPQRISYARPFSLAATTARDIESVALIAPTTVTHSVNTSQRYAGLDVEVIGSGALKLTGPLDGNYAPPGYYMLFLVNSAGVPSEAQFVQLGDFPLGDVDGNGVVSTLDLLYLLTQWGGCVGCSTDLDGDGITGTVDLLLLLANWGS